MAGGRALGEPHGSRSGFREVRLAEARGRDPEPGSGRGAALRVHRGDRMPALVHVQHDPAEVLARQDVLVVGAGSVGRNIVQGLARMGVRSIWIVDPGYSKEASLLTHPILPEEIGEPKALAAAREAKRVSPETSVYVFVGPVEELVLAELPETLSVVFLSSDRLTAESAAGALRTRLGVQLVQAAVHGETLTAQVRYFSGAAEDACPCCLYTRGEWAQLSAETVFSCSGDAPVRKNAGGGRPTRSLAFLCSTAAQLALDAWFTSLLGLGPARENTLFELNGYTLRTAHTPLARKASCPAEHVAWTRTQAPRPLAGCRVRDLVAAAGLEDAAAASASLSVSDHDYVDRSLCSQCGREDAHGRFRARGAGLDPCECGGARIAHPFHLHEDVPLDVLDLGDDRTLADLAAPTVDTVWVRHEGGIAWFTERTSPIDGDKKR